MLDTKLKNSLLYLLTAVLIASGMILTLAGLSPSLSSYSEPREQFSQETKNLYFANYLKNFDDKTLSIDNINNDSVIEYRYRYGNLEDQVRDVTQQYQQRIADATAAKETKKLTELTTERDTKIDAIVLNFTDSTAVKEKILTNVINEFNEAKSKNTSGFKDELKSLNSNYFYYLKDDQGQVFKNIDHVSSDMSGTEIKKELEALSSVPVEAMTISLSPNELMYEVLGREGNLNVSYTELKGYYGVIPDSDAEGIYLREEQSKQNWQRVLVTGVVLLIAGLVLFLRYLQRDFINPKIENLIQRVPIDIRLAGVAVVALFLIALILPMISRMALNNLIFAGVVLLVSILVYLPLLKNLWYMLRQKKDYPSFKTQLSQSFVWVLGEKLTKIYLKSPVVLRLVGLFLLIVATAIIGLFGLFFSSRLVYGGLDVLLVFVLLIGFALIFVSFFVHVVLNHQKSQQLLQKSSQTLSLFKQEPVSGESLTEVEKNLVEIEKIVLNSQAHHVRNEELKTELLTNVSHDLRTPLTSIITYGDLLTQADLSQKDRQAYTEIINQKALRMKHLINDLFEVTKMNNGEIKLAKSPINLGQLLQQTIAEYGEEFEQADLKMLYTKPAEAVMVDLDGEKIWRVFDNLIGNVIKYAMPGTRVYLKLEETNDKIKIELKNISRYELNEGADRLVERFARGDEARNTEGSGLGLAIAHSIIALHEGELNIDVDGDLFKIRLSLPRN